MKLQACQQCGRKFQYNHQLRRHRKVHSLMNRTMYRCKICTASFTFLCNLRQHLAHHFNYKSGEKLFIDDLAIGVTIEPVDNGGQDWTAKQGCKTVTSRESPEGDPCYCVLADNLSVSLCGQQCGECPRHFKSPCRSTSCCPDQTVVPCCGRSHGSQVMRGGCSFTRHINPEYVLHVDTTHDSTMTLSMNENSSDKEVVELTVTDSVSRQYKQVCSRQCVPVRSSTVTREDPECTTCGLKDCQCKEDQDGYDADSDQGEDNSESDGSLAPQEKIPVITVTNEESVDLMTCEEKDCVDEMDDFDDDAACKDLSQMFPFSEFGENPHGSAPDLTCGSLISADVNSEELMEEFSEKEQTTQQPSEVFRPNNENKGIELSDLKVCAKSGLDSKAINPSVVVNDLQNDINIMALPCMRKDNQVSTEYSQPECEPVDQNEDEQERDEQGIFSAVKRRRSGRNISRSTDLPAHNKENSPRKRKDSRVSPRINKGCPPLKLELQMSSNEKLHLSENLKTKMARAGRKQYQSKKTHGPQLKATFKKFDIECYICSRMFTTKQHFIVHAKDHLKRLGYDNNDLFYCTICFAFYPYENDLKEHLIDKHADEDMSPENSKGNRQSKLAEQKPPESYNLTDTYPEQQSSYLAIGGQAVITGQDGEYSGTHNPRYDRRNKDKHGEQFMDFDFSNSRYNHGSDSDIAESTTDQLSFRSDHESDSFGTGQNHSNELRPDVTDPSFCMCHICGETLPSSSYLAQHLKEHDQTAEKFAKLGPEARPRIYGQSSTSTFKCKVCNRGFARLSEVQSHMIVHTPKRQRLKCPLCQGECMWKQNFKNHLLRHATPVGQTFNNVKFNPNSKILCPFCGEVNIFRDAAEFKDHMMDHVNKIMQEECFKSNYQDMIKKAAMNKTKVQEISPPPKQNINPPPQREPIPPTPPRPARARSPVPRQGQAPYSVKCRTLTRQDLQEEIKAQTLAAGMTSTPNPYSSLNTNIHNSSFGSTSQMPTSSIGSGDTSPGGSIRGNSGLFMSPEWAWQPPSRPSQRPAYTNINSQRRLNHDSKSRSELNDSGFIQTFSGESDNNDAYHMTREAHHQPPRPETSDPNRYEFINLARVSELMTTTNTHTEDFTTEGFPCYICRRLKLSQANVKQHLFTHFDNSGRFNFVKKASKHECPMCLKMINDRRSATAHLFSHWGASIIKCPVCDKPFNLIKTLRIHVKKNHVHFNFTPDLYKMM